MSLILLQYATSVNFRVQSLALKHGIYIYSRRLGSEGHTIVQLLKKQIKAIDDTTVCLGHFQRQLGKLLQLV